MDGLECFLTELHKLNGWENEPVFYDPPSLPRSNHVSHLYGLVEPPVGGVEERAAAVDSLVSHCSVVPTITNTTVEAEALPSIEGLRQWLVQAEEEQRVLNGGQCLGV